MNKHNKQQKAGFVAVVGRPNAGKELLNHLIGISWQ